MTVLGMVYDIIWTHFFSLSCSLSSLCSRCLLLSLFFLSCRKLSLFIFPLPLSCIRHTSLCPLPLLLPNNISSSSCFSPPPPLSVPSPPPPSLSLFSLRHDDPQPLPSRPSGISCNAISKALSWLRWAARRRQATLKWRKCALRVWVHNRRCPRSANAHTYASSLA